MLALVNDPGVNFEELDDDAQLNATAARNTVGHRDGPDETPQTGDDDQFDDLGELDAVPYVGANALEALLAHAISKGLLEGGGAEAIFSPQPRPDSHTARIASMIDDAEPSIDIAMYSYRTCRVANLDRV